MATTLNDILPRQGDGTVQLLRKILKALGGTMCGCGTESEHNLLVAILRRLGEVGPIDQSATPTLVRQILSTILGVQTTN